MPRLASDRGSESTTMPDLRVNIQQPALAKYRVPLFRALAARPGLRVTVYYGQEADLANDEPDGFEAHFVPMPQWGVLGRTVRWSRPQIALATPARGDVLVLSWNLNYLSLPPALLRARARGMPTILWGHGFAKDDRWYRRAPRNAVGRLATALLFYNHTTRNEFVAAGYDPARLFVAQNALDDRAIHAAAERWCARPGALEAFRRKNGLVGRRLVLFVSRVTPKARVEWLVEAAARLRERVPNLLVAIVGGGELEAVQKQVNRLGLGSVVRLVGPIYEEAAVAPWFLSGDVFCYPASVGLSLIHAFAYGLPIVTSDNYALRNPEIEALDPGSNGLLYRHGDVADLAHQLAEVLGDEPRRAAMATAARRTVSERYNLRTMVDGFEAAIRFAAAQRAQA